MTRNVRTNATILAALCALTVAAQTAGGEGRGQRAVTSAARNNQFAFVMFYRSNNAATQNMYRILNSTLSRRKDAAIVPIRIADASEAALVKQFDATRIPMPAVAVLAPNGAVCSVIPQRVSESRLVACIVSAGQAKCLKALQDGKIVALCAQPSAQAEIPAGVRHFRADKAYSKRSEVVTVLATDPNEAKFLRQLKVPTRQRTPVVAFMAPPGVMVGVFNANVTHNELTAKLAAAGKCCDDKNCKHHKSGVAQRSSRR